MPCKSISMEFHPSRALSHLSLFSTSLQCRKGPLKNFPLFWDIYFKFYLPLEQAPSPVGNTMMVFWDLGIPFLFILSLKHLSSSASICSAVHVQCATGASDSLTKWHGGKPAVISVLATWTQPQGLGWKCSTVCLVWTGNFSGMSITSTAGLWICKGSDQINCAAVWECSSTLVSD